MRTPASSPWAPAAGWSDTASIPAISARSHASSCMSWSAPCAEASGASGWTLAKPARRATSSLSLGLYFIVHEPGARAGALPGEARQHALGRLRRLARELLEERRQEAQRDARHLRLPRSCVVGLRRRQLADFHQPPAPERRQIDRRHQRAQRDVAADVRRRLGAADVLLARLQGQNEATFAVVVDGGADEPPGHAPDQLVLRGEDAEVRASEVQGHAEPLPFAHDDVGAELARAL